MANGFNLDVGFGGLRESQITPQAINALSGLSGGGAPQAAGGGGGGAVASAIPSALLALAGIANPYGNYGGVKDFIQSSVASKAHQQQQQGQGQGNLTEANVTGNTSEQRTKVPGGYKIVTTSFESDDSVGKHLAQNYNPL